LAVQITLANGSDYRHLYAFTRAAQKGTSIGFSRVWVSVMPTPPCQLPPAYFPSSQLIDIQVILSPKTEEVSRRGREWKIDYGP